jgi:hypothetical protein
MQKYKSTCILEGSMQVKKEQSSAPVLYWEGVIGEELLLDKYQPTIEKILHGDYKGAHATRLLLVPKVVGNKSYLLLLGEVLNHDYTKSKFLKPEILKDYLDKQCVETAIKIGELLEITKDSFETCETPSEALRSCVSHEETIILTAVKYYDEEFITLSSEQDIAVTSWTGTT